MGFQLILFDLIGKVVFFLRGEPSLVKCCFQLILFDLIGKMGRYWFSQEAVDEFPTNPI